MAVSGEVLLVDVEEGCGAVKVRGDGILDVV